ncbi:MAG: DUF4093 domain-containing protein [Clostridia bacterium]|nr:DUF4093 domain-containing protein [Clostridia bacterium]HAQ63195.1 DUF4093 domain-containing protein [Oscillospiraceae bacterium]
MIKIKQAVIVEGKYDKIKLEQILDAVIIQTDGFGIFKDKQKQKFIRALAEKKGILILTDSDSAGFVIRSFLSGIVSPEYITHAYIPDILGKEKRKSEASKEGKLGVEGVSNEVILKALETAGIIGEQTDSDAAEKKQVTKTDLYNDGICGKSNSLEKRRKLLKVLNLPERTSANSMLKIINTFLSYEDYKQAVKDIEN